MTTAESDDERAAIKAHFIAERGYWRPWTEALLRDNPGFLASYATYAGHPARVGPLSERMVELIYVALDASATHLFGPGLRTHLERALAVGARPQDIFDILHIVAAQGLDSVYQAAEILAEEIGMAKAGPAQGRLTDAGQAGGGMIGAEDVPAELQARIERLQLPAPPAAIVALFRLDPGYLPVLLDFLEHGRPSDGLSVSERSLVETALHACFSGFNPQSLRQRIRRSLDHGSTPSEVLQAIQLGAHLSVHGTALGAGIFAEMRAA